MKKLLLGIAVVCQTLVSYAQAPAIQWQKSLGGSGDEESYCIQPTMDGGYIVVGASESIDGQVTGHHGSGSNFDYWVVKLDDAGGIQWENSYGGTTDEIVYYVRQTFDSGYILAGESESTDGDLSTCAIIQHDYWVLKLSPTGAIVWKNCYGSHGGAAFNEAYCVQQTPDSGYVVGGYTNSMDSDEVTGYHGNNDYWLVRLTSSGGFSWAKCYGGTGSDIGKCVQNTSDGGFIMIGTTNSTNDDVTGFHGGPTDYWVVKVNDTGGLQWEKCYGGTYEDDGKYIVQTADGGYLLAGASYSNDGQVTGHHGDTTAGDYWIVKINDTGMVEWETSLGGSQDEIAYSAQETADSGFIIAGSANSTDGQVTGSYGQDDYWIVKVGKDGAFQWQKSLGGSGTDDAYFIKQTPDSGFIVTGGSNSTDGEVTGDHGAYDYWAVKLGACQLASSPVIVKTGSSLGTSLPYASYKWELNGAAIAGATNATCTITSNGNYTVFVTDTNGCAGQAATAYTVVEVENVAANYLISLVPNPTTGAVNIVGLSAANVQVYDIVGQLRLNVQNKSQVSVAGLPTGVYIFKIYDKYDNLLLVTRVLKE